MSKYFNESELRSISDALGDTNIGLTGSEIGQLLRTTNITDYTPDHTKRQRLFNAFAYHQNTYKNGQAILDFLREAMKPSRYLRDTARYEPMRENVNKALSFSGFAVLENGEVTSTLKATTISEAESRASILRADLSTRNIHPDILIFCRAELLKENYFHAILEATKSVAQKLRDRTGLQDDGAILVERALGGDLPILSINSLTNESERSEQKGFANIVKGAFGMYRNTTAHAPKINWAVNKIDAEETLTILSMLH